jgi:hypothetical protein
MAPKDDDDSSPLAVTPDDSSSPLAVAPDDSSSLLAVAAPDDSDAPKLVPSSLLDSKASKIVGSSPLESMAIDFLPDSEVVPDSLPPGAFFAHIVSLFMKTANRGIMHTQHFWPCARCGLVHMDYMVFAMLYGFVEFACEVFMPDLDKVIKDGNNIMLDADVLKMLEENHKQEIATRKKDA